MSSIEGRGGGHLRPVVDDDLDLLPPGREAALAGTDFHVHTVAGFLAGELRAQIFALLIAEAVPIVEIDGAFAVRAGVDAELERALRGFVGALNERLHGDDAS